MDTLFSHVNVVTMNEQMTLWQDAFVGVTDGKIAYMAKKPPEEKPKKIIDATGMVLMPGLINCHTHLPMYLLRGYADDLNLQDWLQHYIFPREDRLDGRAVKAATTLALAEALRFGTTSVSDMYYFCDEICQAVAESGIKANISRGTSMFLGDDFCFDTFPACQELVALKDKWHNYDNGRIKIEASIHAEYTSTYQLWDALAEYAVNNGLQLQVHLSETKKGTRRVRGEIRSDARAGTRLPSCVRRAHDRGALRPCDAGGYAAAGQAPCIRGTLPGQQSEAGLWLRGRARHGKSRDERLPRHGLCRIQQQSRFV